MEFPSVNLPDFDVPRDPLLLSDQDIEDLAEDARKFWRMSDGPVGNMVYLLENQGVIVARDSLGDVTLDSLSAISDRPYVMIGKDKGTAVRWRYDAAHELGHLLLHRNLNPKALARPTDFKLIERQAHRFGAAFLLPMAPFADDFFAASLDTLRAIKPRWRVSIAMMIMRARDGDLISDEVKRRLFINYSRRRWHRSEPLDDTLEPETPDMMRKAVELIVTHGARPVRALPRMSRSPRWISKASAACSAATCAQLTSRRFPFAPRRQVPPYFNSGRKNKGRTPFDG